MSLVAGGGRRGYDIRAYCIMNRAFSSCGDSVSRLNILGTLVSVVNMESVVGMVSRWVMGDAKGRYVCVTGVHGIMEGLRNPSIQSVHNRAHAVVPDGMPLSWIGWLRGHRDMDRVYGPDLMLAMLELSVKRGWTNYFYGGKPGVAVTLKLAMECRFPGLKVVGTCSPPFGALSSSQEREILDEINSIRPDLLWIGLSTPKQEMQMAAFSPKAEVKVMFGVGAAFDFHSGLVRQAPRWIQRGGLEWLFRLCMEPRRLASRYLHNNPLFLFHVFLQMTGIRAYPINDKQVQSL